MARSIMYLPVDELLFEGYKTCSAGYDREEIDLEKPYVVIKCERDENAIYYRKQKIASEPVTAKLSVTDPFYTANGSVQLYHDAYRWLLHRLTDIIALY